METETAARSLLCLSSHSTSNTTSASSYPKLPPPSALHLPKSQPMPLPKITTSSPTQSHSSTVTSHSSTSTPHTVPSTLSIPTIPPLPGYHVRPPIPYKPLKLPPIETLSPPYSPKTSLPQVTPTSITSVPTFTSPASTPTSRSSPVISAAFNGTTPCTPARLDFPPSPVHTGRIHKKVENPRRRSSKSCTTLITGMPTFNNLPVSTAHRLKRQEQEKQVVQRAYKKVYSNATPSSYCHVCSRTRKSVQFAECALIQQGLCRKVICDKCFKTFGWDWEFAKSGNWICVHCRDQCPARAQCHIYKKINSRRGSNKKSKCECRENDCGQNGAGSQVLHVQGYQQGGQGVYPTAVYQRGVGSGLPPLATLITR